jgi:chromosome partitioning protein
VARIIAISNQKGGVGKTTTAINLAASLAAAERNVLLVDLDPQGNAGSGLGLDKTQLAGSIYDVLVDGRPLREVIAKTQLKYLDLVPSTPDLTGAEIELVNLDRREHRLKDALKSVARDYEYVIIDSPPSLGLLTLNGLVAADSILVPLQCEYYALEGLAQLLGTVDRIKESLNPRLEVEGIVLTLFDQRANIAHQVADEARKVFPELVFKTVVPRNVRLAESPSFGKPILLYDIKSRGCEAYLSLARELLRRDKARAHKRAARVA